MISSRLPGQHPEMVQRLPDTSGVRPDDQLRLRAALREALESRTPHPMRLELTGTSNV